ncbi:hypothetical protein [uncultured Bifidobacterium sp.]|uniref:hypothetical protein n=1 Tax=uncultured Bifidobacterium sp. TaxID=165187 RepID=UPI002624BE1D|nr:hypothetical protein [uncultured Bifidobacterium sp.]
MIKDFAVAGSVETESVSDGDIGADNSAMVNLLMRFYGFDFRFRSIALTARDLLPPPHLVLILDEATSSIDTRTGELIPNVMDA